MNFISKIRNLLKPKYRLVYRKESTGDFDTYILINPSWAKGRPPHFSNDYYRAKGIFNKGFKAVCLNRQDRNGKNAVRSFNYDGIQSVQKLTFLESLA